MTTKWQPRPKAAITPIQSFTPAVSGLLQRKCACDGTPGLTGECEACRKKREKGMLQRKATHPSSFNPDPSEVPPIVHEVLRSPGQPIDSATRAFMEPRFGHDFSKVRTNVYRSAPVPARLTIGAPHDELEQEADRVAQGTRGPSSAPINIRHDFSGVRVHTDARAAESAQAVGAHAYTVGHHIAFAAGQFTPGTHQGRRLLAHELAHVLQQGDRGFSIQRKVKEKTPCSVHAYDNSNPKDPAIVPTDGSGIGVSSVADLVTKVNAYVNDDKSNCSCLNRLDINGHGTDGYQSVGNGSSYINNDKALVHDSTEENLQQLSKIKFCSTALFMLIGCHVGRGNGKTLLHRLSAILPGKLIGGAQHFTSPTAKGGPVVQGAGDILDASGNIDMSKADPFLASRFVRWHLTIEGKEYVINGDETTSTENKGKLKAAEKIKVKTPEGVVNIK